MTQRISPLRTAITLRCPACGVGRLYNGLLAVADACTACGLSFAGHEKGDGPAFFVIIVAGFAVTGLAAWVELAYMPPYWLHALLWPPLIVVLCLYLLRFFKALIIAAQFLHQEL